MQNYNEKFVEEFIKEYPLDFLGESLSLYKQQPTIEGLRPDLIFKDEQNNFTIVEVQLNALDRNHLYKTLEYRDLFKEHEKSNTPRIILFCNEIKRQYEKILKIHNINRICMERKKFWDLCVSLKPKLKEQKIKEVKKKEPLIFTVNDLFRKIQSPIKDEREDIDAVVYHDSKNDEVTYYKYSKNLLSSFFNDSIREENGEWIRKEIPFYVFSDYGG